ncbi:MULTISPECIES: hypothetical protein [unclassified Streptomyces]|uniref:hypothetical protein n=1 Tax=unclassified Streptomyces TaxID=2593676 RepID=UPI002E18A132|nr:MULTISPECIES: hypothetical protein [unclassified Streptomyces]
MAADEGTSPHTHRAAPLAPLPEHRDVNTPWWQELWRRHAHITTPLRARGLECDIEFGLSAYILRVPLPDDSCLIISPPQEPPSKHPPGDPEGWIATREPRLREALASSQGVWTEFNDLRTELYSIPATLSAREWSQVRSELGASALPAIETWLADGETFER